MVLRVGREADEGLGEAGLSVPKVLRFSIVDINLSFAETLSKCDEERRRDVRVAEASVAAGGRKSGGGGVVEWSGLV